MDFPRTKNFIVGHEDAVEGQHANVLERPFRWVKKDDNGNDVTIQRTLYYTPRQTKDGVTGAVAWWITGKVIGVPGLVVELLSTGSDSLIDEGYAWHPRYNPADYNNSEEKTWEQWLADWMVMFGRTEAETSKVADYEYDGDGYKKSGW
ncbi:hypothetical protein LTR17_019489 [Elasticomyces elasticus]|nr:hypothetical protein LTR17_019489 [Elasticomyces elasticus]